jgi:uncharacterized SAM-binding protein YcdF (DUF218 family)
VFFQLSKLLGFFALPTNLLISLGVLGLLLLLTRFTRLASWLVVTSLVLLAVAGLSPLGKVLILPLEQRFPPWDPSQGVPDGIVMLGGAVLADVSIARGTIALDEAAARLAVTVELARRYPNARILISGGPSSLIYDEEPEAGVAMKELEALGIPHDRISVEEQSRNTVENAVFSRLIANPKPGERWLLVTSAFHMPRAVGTFRAAGFPIEPYPTDYRTRGPGDMVRPFAVAHDGLQLTDTAAHEWLGLLAYRLTGRTMELFPGPQ